MPSTINDIMSFVEENDVKFIRLAFCDPFGVHKNISIISDKLESALTNGIPFDCSSINGFSGNECSDLLLIPDPKTLIILPWRPYPGRVIRFYCQVTHHDKTPFKADSRLILKQAISRAENMGYSCDIGSKCEFYLFKTDENGEPTKTTLDRGSFLDISPLDKGEDIRREICLHLEEMGLQPEDSYHEKGPGQNEIDFKFSNALMSADNLLTFKSAVKSIAGRNGLYASFMPKPLLSESGSGLHINLSLYKNNENIFSDIDNNSNARSFIEGVLCKTAEMTIFLNSITNSFERIGQCDAPAHISWTKQNRFNMITTPCSVSDNNHIEIHSPDPAINPYIAFALIINAGLDGIEANLELRKSCDEVSNKNDLPCIPKHFDTALNLAKNSEFIKKYLDFEMTEQFFKIKEEEFSSFEKSSNKELFYDTNHFKTI